MYGRPARCVLVWLALSTSLIFNVIDTLAQPSPGRPSGRPLSGITPFIAGGQNDQNSLEANVVVLLTSNRTCTGTLVTPMAVLTARHCVNGDESGNPPIQYPVTITVGSDKNLPIHQYSSHNIIPSKTWAPGPQRADLPGNDIAVIFLDPLGSGGITRPGNCPPASGSPQPEFCPGPVLEDAQIIHPSLSSPCPTTGCGDDANGGDYDPQLGMAGWAPQDAPRYRQVAYDTEFHHFPGKPDDRGQYWEHRQGSIHDNPGDSGGPLFVRRPVPNMRGVFYRDVIGVLHGVQSVPLADFDNWVDVTRGAIADWVRNALADPIPRGPKWRAQHPGLIWIGDVDYTGPCNTALDRDCDHVYDIHDNCPDVFNPDQRDTNDQGRGDACPPPPPQTPPNCGIAFSCPFVDYTPPDYTVTCDTVVDFYRGYDENSRSYFKTDSTDSGTTTNDIMDEWGCERGTLNCRGFSLFKNVTEWCGPPPPTVLKCNCVPVFQKCCEKPDGRGKMCISSRDSCPKQN